MNKFIGIGRLVRDPELRYTQSNQPICTFTLAIDKPMSRDKREEAEANNRPTADFPRVNVWGKMAESCNRYLQKGSQCAVVGSLQTGSYQDKDGKTVYTTDILANSVEFLSKASGGQDNTNQNSDDGFFGDDFTKMEDNGAIPF
nr:MAG TPA: Single strand binding protein [Caudoviricetes sp.]